MVSVAHGFTAHCVAMIPIRPKPLEISARVSADKLNDAGTTAPLESDGVTGGSILDVKIEAVDQRTALCIGSSNEVDRFNEMICMLE